MAKEEDRRREGKKIEGTGEEEKRLVFGHFPLICISLLC